MRRIGAAIPAAFLHLVAAWGNSAIAQSAFPSRTVKFVLDGMFFAATNRCGQTHLTGELFRVRAKANIHFVHASSAATSISNVMAGRIPIMFEGLPGLAPGLHGGYMRMLGVASVKRLPNLPDLPK